MNYMLSSDIYTNNIDYKMQIVHNGEVIDITTGYEKYDIEVMVKKSNLLQADNFEITISNLPIKIMHKIKKARIEFEGISTIKMQVKGNASNMFYEIINKEAVEIISRLNEDGTTYLTKMYGYSGSALTNGISNINFTNSTIEDVIKKLANDVGMSVENVAGSFSKINTERSNFIFGNDSVRNHLHRMSNSIAENNANMFIDKQKIVILDKSNYRKKHTISSKNLKNSPIPMANTIPLEMYLYPAINIGDLIEINDDINNQISGSYTVSNCTHRFNINKRSQSSGKTTLDLLVYKKLL